MNELQQTKRLAPNNGHFSRTLPTLTLKTEVNSSENGNHNFIYHRRLVYQTLPTYIIFLCTASPPELHA